ncbi:MAG: hypothetical protein JWP52_4633 [Rhizobacter sp.]|nr:hypothetical protein [Rhizobacter sp.]
MLAAAVVLLAAVGTVSWALELQLARGFVVLALPLAAVLTLVQRRLTGTGCTASAVGATTSRRPSSSVTAMRWLPSTNS